MRGGHGGEGLGAVVVECGGAVSTARRRRAAALHIDRAGDRLVTKGRQVGRATVDVVLLYGHSGMGEIWACADRWAVMRVSVDALELSKAR